MNRCLDNFMLSTLLHINLANPQFFIALGIGATYVTEIPPNTLIPAHSSFITSSVMQVLMASLCPTDLANSGRGRTGLSGHRAQQSLLGLHWPGRQLVGRRSPGYGGRKTMIIVSTKLGTDNKTSKPSTQREGELRASQPRNLVIRVSS